MSEDKLLWQKIKEKNNQVARQKIIIKYLPLVKYHAGRIKMCVPNFVEESDLESYGIIGLIDAINKFDYQQGIKFKTYASKRIRGEIIDHLRKLDWLPHSLRKDGKRVQEMADKMTKKLGRKPNADEIANKLNISREKVYHLYYKLYSSQWVSIFNQIGDSQLLDLMPDDSSQEPENLYQQKERVRLLAEAIEHLNKDEQMIVSLYYYEELTQKEIAQLMGLSPARVSQLHKKAIYRLRGSLSRKKEQLL